MSESPLNVSVPTATAPEVQKPAAEAAPEVQKPAQQDDKFAAKFAALSRQEKQLRQERQALEAARKEIEGGKSEMQKWKEEQKTAESELLKKFKANPLKFAEENGLTFEDLMKMQLNEQNPTPEMMIKREREQLESMYRKDMDELKQSLKQKEEAEAKKAYDSTVSGFKSEIKDYVTTNLEKCELIDINGAHDLVFDVIQEYYESTGRILSIEEAAQHTEAHLEEGAQKILRAKKFHKAETVSKEATTTKAAPTLSNTQSSEVPQSGERKLSREESLKRAAKMIRWHE